MNRRRFYVDTLGFLGDVGPPMYDDRTKKNARDSGVRLFVMTTTWPLQEMMDPNGDLRSRWPTHIPEN